MIKTVKVEDAVGLKLAHDITEIRPGEFKGPAFRQGHAVCEDDLCRLQRLGKNHLYVIDLEEDEIHENEAAAILAQALAGEGIVWENNPREGKIDLYAADNGLLKVDVPALAAFNLVDEVMCATLHSHTLVKQGELVGGTRALPLIMKRAAIERAAAVADEAVALGADAVHQPGVMRPQFFLRLLVGCCDVARRVDADRQHRLSKPLEHLLVQLRVAGEPLRVAADDRQHERQPVMRRAQ